MSSSTQSQPVGMDAASAQALEEQILQLQKITDYEVHEYPVEVLVEKFTKGLEDDTAELFIPDYQREFIWELKQQSRFIESILMNLPIPYLFVADVAEGDRKGSIEIVDGTQRMRTLVHYVRGGLRLQGLEKIPLANGTTFEQLSPPRQKRFLRKTLRMIELTEHADEEARREIFDRLNTGGTSLTKMEQRRGSRDGAFTLFVQQLAELPLFRQLCPVSPARSKRREYNELVLRYLAFSARYKDFKKSVHTFLSSYLDDQNRDSTEQSRALLKSEFEHMLEFVAANLLNGFQKNAANTSVPRIRFEALSVGVTLALREQARLAPRDIVAWLGSEEFVTHTRSDASNSRPKVVNRIHFVRDHLLGRPVELDGGPEPHDDEANELPGEQ
jgi:Protein of unknown function DUF262